MASPHTITHDHTISVWFYDSDLSCGYVYVPAKARGRGRAGAVWTGVVPQTCASGKRHIYIQTGNKHQTQTPPRTERERAEQTHASKHTHKHRCFPSTRRPSVAFFSLPLAVSQIPDDGLTGGLSDWRWGCVMTDQGLYQWPAHCQLAVWRLTGRLKPKTAAVPAWLPLYIFLFFFFPFNP